jgi:hypothetical protein
MQKSLLVEITEYAGISAQENLPSMQRSLLQKSAELVQISAAEILSTCVDLCHWKSLSLQRYLMLKIHQRYSYLCCGRNKKDAGFCCWESSRPAEISAGEKPLSVHRSSVYCCSRSRRRAANGSKRMYLDYTHGLFIT